MREPYHSTGYNKSCKTKDGRMLLPSERTHQCNLKLTADEILKIKALARHRRMRMNAIVALAIDQLFQANPLPLDN